MSDISSIKYSALKESHLSDVQQICKKAFDKSFSIEYLKKKYDCNYLGISPVATIAHEGQNPVAFYGAIPQLFENKSDSFLIAHACDSYTIPSHQKKGIHRSLALKSYDLMQQQSLKMVYAFHSENTYFSTKKLNWEDHHQMKRFHIKTQSLPIARLASKFNLTSWINQHAQKVLAPYQSSNHQNPLRNESTFCQRYSDSFYEYKAGFGSHFSLEIERCKFYLKLGMVMQIGFVEFPDIQGLKRAIEILKKLAGKLFLNEILFQLDPNCEAYKAMKVSIEDKPSWLIGYLKFDRTIQLDQFAFNYADLDTF